MNQGIEKEITYVFNCGCHFKEKDVPRTKHGKIYCDKHSEAKLFKRTRICEICGEKIEQFSSRGGVAFMCKPCRIEQDIIKAKIFRDELKILEQKSEGDVELSKKHKPDIHNRNRKSKCIHYSECMSYGGYFMTDRKATCDGCKRYESKELDIMDYMYKKE